MKGQRQFLDVIDRDVAEARFREALRLDTLGTERVALAHALGRVLAAGVVAAVDVPSFDRSNFDGYAVRASDTTGATEEGPVRLRRLAETIPPGVRPRSAVSAGEAITIATGGMVPRGADAVVMVEHTEEDGDALIVYRGLAPGFGISFAGTDMTTGETVLHEGTLLTSRETGVLAAIGVAEIEVFRRPTVAILSTGDELIEPGAPMEPPAVYDSNARILADAVRELGGEPAVQPIVTDNLEALRARLADCLERHDAVLLSGGTSKGEGDLCYEAVSALTDPGIVAHGVALKPGKPICLAVHGGKPVVVLPGFPTSAVFTFHEFVAPVLRILGGRPPAAAADVDARLAVPVRSTVGRKEYLLVGLVQSAEGLAAYPMGKGSGSVTAFSRADGFVAIDRHTEIVDPGTPVRVRLLGRDLEPADLVVMGSHCVGVDLLLSRLQRRGLRTKFLSIGSTGGLYAARRGECDLAGIHLLDPDSGTYNEPFLEGDEQLLPGYGRQQGFLFRADDDRFAGKSVEDIWALVRSDATVRMINRNAGSGTRVLIDQGLGDARPDGHAVQAHNHHAVAAAVVQQRADWGVAIEVVARQRQLGFVPLAAERYDFVLAAGRADRPAVQAFRDLLADAETRRALRDLGFEPSA